MKSRKIKSLSQPHIVNPLSCFTYWIPVSESFPGGSVVKNMSANAGETVQSLGQEDLLEEEMATHSSILAEIVP